MRPLVRPACVLIVISLWVAACGSSPTTPTDAGPIGSSAAGQLTPTTSMEPTTQASAQESTKTAIQADAQAAVDQAAASFPRPSSARPIKPDQRLVEGFIVPPGNVVQKTIYLSSTDSVQRTLAFFASALADDSGSSSSGDFSAGSFHVKIVQLTLPGGGSEYSAPMAQIGVAAVAGGVIIGVQISSDWNPARPVNTYIGPSPGVVDVQQGPADAAPTFNGEVSGAGATQLAAAVDALGLQANATYSCPSTTPTATKLIFHPHGQAVTVTLLNGCPYGPFLAVGGRTYTLAPNGTVGDVLHSVLRSLPTT